MSKQQVQLKEKELTVGDLMPTDHVGFTHENTSEKGYVSLVKVNGQDKLVALAAVSQYGKMVDLYSNPFHDYMTDLFKELSCAKEVYRFDTRKELYQWLAEG